MSLTVSTLINYLKRKIDEDANLHNFLVVGEISNFHRQNVSGHCYFTLKDEKSQISCVMFNAYANKLDFEPKNGDKVLINGYCSIFENLGQLQIYCMSIKLDGLGLLYQQYEQLKNKLTTEGYFSSDHKKVLINKYLTKVAVLVGDKSAAMSDIKTCFLRRWPLCQVDYYPVLVQGNDASKSIIETLLKVDELNYEVIILARGGGSFEDLFCFNDEQLVKTIYNLKTFIVTGVGHEQDYTLVDFVADLRAPTPTAAVELITPDIKDIKNEINEYKDKISILIKRKLDIKKMNIDYYNERLLKFNLIIERYKNLINECMFKIESSLKDKLNIKNNQISTYSTKLNIYMQNIISKKKLDIKRLNALLKAYAVDNVLERGYSLTFKDNKIIKSINEVEIDNNLEIRLKDGIINSLVKEKKNG